MPHCAKKRSLWLLSRGNFRRSNLASFCYRINNWISDSISCNTSTPMYLIVSPNKNLSATKSLRTWNPRRRSSSFSMLGRRWKTLPVNIGSRLIHSTDIKLESKVKRRPSWQGYSMKRATLKLDSSFETILQQVLSVGCSFIVICSGSIPAKKTAFIFDTNLRFVTYFATPLYSSDILFRYMPTCNTLCEFPGSFSIYGITKPNFPGTKKAAFIDQ